MKRIDDEFSILKEFYPSAILSADRDWVEVPDLPLLTGLYNREIMRVRMAIGPAYPDVAPDNFFVPAGLRLQSGAGLDNYSEVAKFGELWGQFSWHPRIWRAAAKPDQGDNMSTFFNTIRKRLEEGK
jgi:hypothetical protein